MTRRSRLALVVLAGAVLAGCGDSPQNTWDPAGPNAQQIHDLQWPVFLVAGIVGLIVFAAVGYSVVKFRDRGQPIPEQSHGNRRLEIALTILPALILAGVAAFTLPVIFDLSRTSDTECVVNVTGQQWWWEMDYAVQDGCGGIDQPIVTSGQMVIPTDTDVLIRGTSRDVIHSFWIPRLNGKRDMVPGRVHTLRMNADEPGIYAGQCAEFCGLSHANMRMEVVALSPEDFEAWKTNQYRTYEPPEAETLAAAGEATFITNCARCHQVNGLETADGEPIIARPDLNVWSGAAPNLTYFSTRTTFAGATWSTLSERCSERVWNADPDAFGDLYLAGVTADCLNEVDLREWLRNAPAKKPMYTEPDDLEPTDGLPRGMPYLALSEDQIDELIAYLLTRK